MAFKRGKHPALSIDEKDLRDVVALLLAAGYAEHDGPATKVEGEMLAMRKRFVSGRSGRSIRQNHVQFVHDIPRHGRGVHRIHVFAHTEPWRTIPHAIAALTNGVSYQAGARMLRKDIAGVTALGARR